MMGIMIHIGNNNSLILKELHNHVKKKKKVSKLLSRKRVPILLTYTSSKFTLQLKNIYFIIL